MISKSRNSNLFLALILALSLAFTSFKEGAAANLCVNPAGTDGCYPTIQAAIDAASPGDTINVEAGTYVEQLTISKSLHIVGAGIGSSIIQAPSSLPDASQQTSAIIIVSGNGVNTELNSFTVTGPGPTTCGSIRAGIFVRDSANANIHDNLIQDIRDSTFSGCQNGVAIWVGRQAWATNGTATINHNTIIGYQKGGIVVDNTGSDATISNNTITGVGTTDVIAQNGIQISRGATSTLSGNTVTGNSFHLAGDPSDWGSTGILLYQSGAVTLSGGNSASGNDQNLYKTGSPGLLTLGAETFGASTAPAGIGFDITNDDSLAVNATSVTFVGAADGFAIEDRVYHKLDNASLGLVTWTANNVYVTPDSGSIQRGIDAVSAGYTVNVAPGTYIENLTIPTPLTLAGANQATTIVQPSVSGPTCTSGGGSICPGGTNVVLVQANDVIIHDLTVDGDNPALTSGAVFGGADLDARNGIITNHSAGTYNNLEVYNVTVKNIFLRGMYASSGGSFNFHNNTVTNVQADPASIAMFAWGGPGTMSNNTVSFANDAISANHSKGIQFLNNTVTHSASGLHTDNSADGGGVADLLQGNSVDCTGVSDAYGIFVFVPYMAPTVNNNTVTNCTTGLSAWGQGAAVTTQFTNNTVNGPAKAAGSVGVYVTSDLIGWGYTDISAAFTGNVITGNETGIYLTADAQAWNPNPWTSQTVTAVFSNNQITGNTKGLDKGATGTYTATAIHNWWGSVTGPGTVGTGSGDTIVAGVSYTPWCGDAACSFFLPPFNTTTTISSDTPDPSTSGQTVTINFSVANAVAGGPVPAGTVDITDGVTVICNDIALDGSGNGSCTFAFSTTGAHPLTAAFTPTDTTLFNGSSDTEAHTVNTPPTITEGALIGVTMSEDGSPIPFSLDLHASDPDLGDVLAWTISTQPAHGSASASGTGLSKAIVYTPALNYNGPDTFVVQVSDSYGATDTITVNVTINAVNSAPTDLSLSNSNVNENQPAGTVIGTLSTTDPDVGDSFTYSFCGGADDSSFTLDVNALKTGGVFDYETRNSYTVCIRIAVQKSFFQKLKGLAIHSG